MALGIRALCCIALVALLPAHAAAQDYPGYPDTIMTPAPGSVSHSSSAATLAIPPHSPHASLLGHEKFVAELHRGPRMFATRGSPGSVLPTPLPRTKLIPPEGSGTLAMHPAPQEQGPTILPGGRAVPNLSHGPETFQDRASRCAFQQGLYGAQGAASPHYMGACLQ